MKISKKLTCALTAGVMAFALFGMAGCASESGNTAPKEMTTEEINAQDIQVTESGFTVLPDQTVSYAFTIENPNEEYVANSVTFTIEGYDANDVMLIGGGETIQEVYPGITTAAAGTAYLSQPDATIARFEVKPLMQNVIWTKSTESTEELQGMFQLTDDKVTETNGTMSITGTISTDLPEESSSSDATSALDNRRDAHVVAILRDANGKILCGGTAMGVMLDPSMTPIITSSSSTGTVPGTVDENGNPLDENGNPVEPDNGEAISEEPMPEEGGGDDGANVATTTYTITIPGIVNYATVSVYATPGI